MGICLEMMRKLGDYLQQKLPPRDSELLRSHIRKCHDCRLVLDSAQRTLETYFASGQHRAA
jgi:hypothetical protein